MKAKGLIFTLVLGFSIGVVSTLGTVAFITKDVKNYVISRVGEFLDTDIIYLENGDVMEGRIVSQDPKKIVFQSAKGMIEFSLPEITRIEYNYYTRYIRKFK